MCKPSKTLLEIKKIFFDAIMGTGKLSKKHAVYCTKILMVVIQKKWGGRAIYMPAGGKKTLYKKAIQDAFYEVLIQKCEYPCSTVKLIAEACADCLLTHFMKDAVYFPVGHNESIKQRDQEMAAMFDGTNHKEIAAVFGMTLRNVYNRIDNIKRCNETKLL